MIDRQELEHAVRLTLLALGEDPDRVGLAQTPRRIADSWEEFYAGREVRVTGLPDVIEDSNDVVAVRDIDFVSICEHHLLPYSGVTHVAYQPSSRLLGLSDIPRLVRRASAGLSLQEPLTRAIVEEIQSASDAAGVLVAVEARHGCVSDRGIRQSRARVFTIAATGTMDSPGTRSEILALLGVSE